MRVRAFCICGKLHYDCVKSDTIVLGLLRALLGYNLPDTGASCPIQMARLASVGRVATSNTPAA